MTHFLFATLFLLFSVSALANFEIMVGEQRILPIPSGVSVIVTNPKTVKVIPSGKKVILIGKSPGLSEVRLGAKLLHVVVFSTKLEELRKTVSPWIRQIYGLKLETMPEKLHLTGEVYRLTDWIQLQKWRHSEGKLLKFEVHPAQALLPQLQEALEEALRERALTSGKSQLVHGEIELLSYTKNKEELHSLRELAEEWGVTPPSPSAAVELRPMIEVEIVIAEMKKNAMQTLGLQTPGAYSATIIPAGDLSALATTFNPIIPQFNALFANGSSRILANPKLLCRSGEVAHFLAGGEIPLKIVNWKTSDVTWKRYGVILDITPLADMHDAISTKLVTEISLLDEAHKVDGIPGLLTNRIETHFDLRGSKTIALSGLIKSELGRGENGIPLLGQIPILGELFKSRDYRDSRTELVVFVTPRVISPENPPQVQKKSISFWTDQDDDGI